MISNLIIMLMEIISIVIAFAVAISVHEASHALAAYYFGDPTAKLHGRLSLNPLRHLDPLGTILIFLVHFGWGKPVPVNPYNLKNPRRDEAFISLSGPIANFLTAALLALPVKYWLIHAVSGWGVFLLTIFAVTISLNLTLMVFNLIPIPPLDGSKVFFAFLPDKWAHKIPDWEHKGPLVLFGLVLASNLLNFPIFSYVLGPAVDFLQAVIFLSS